MAKTILVDDLLGRCCVCQEPSTVRYSIDVPADPSLNSFAAYCDEHRDVADQRWRVIHEGSNQDTERS
jgi:hypothetical protein